jgi:uncharacterized OB-fold protein
MSYSGVSAPPDSVDLAAAGGKPVPDQRDPVTQPFWHAANERRLVIQQCQACRRFHHPPIGLCWDCLSADLRFTEVSGAGQVYSFAVVRDQRQSAFDALVPYIVATVSLDDAPGVFLRSNLPGVAIDDVRSGMAVRLDFEEIVPGINIPQFRTATERET